MLHALLTSLSDVWFGFNVFRYITFRSGLAIATAFFISIVIGPWLIARLRSLQIRQSIREEGPEHHQVKAGTPTMGGVLIVGSFVLTTLLWGDLGNPYVWTVLVVTMAFAAIGFVDQDLVAGGLFVAKEPLCEKRAVVVSGRPAAFPPRLTSCPIQQGASP